MKVAIIMGSKSDYPVLEETIQTLKDFGVEVDVRVMSAHRTPKIAAEFAEDAQKNGYKVLIAAAGKAAHLAGVIAGHTVLPVIGLPIRSSFMDGMDSLLSTVQMPRGVPVATVGVNAGTNAALLAVQILSVGHSQLVPMVEAYKKNMANQVVEADAELKKELDH